MASVAVRQTAVAIIKALKDAGDDGILTDDFDRQILKHKGNPAMKAQAAVFLREFGIPVVAERRRHLTTWHLARKNSALAEQWRVRIINDAYSEVVRAHQALVGKPGMRDVCRSLKQSAVALGSEMDYDLSEIQDHLKPTVMGDALQKFLTEYV